MSDLLPNALTASVLAELTKQSAIMRLVTHDPNTSKYRHVPLDLAWIEARANFAERFNALVEEGIEAGYLEHGDCYECPGELQITDNTTRYEAIPE